jgi:hypothetical protein
MDGGTRCAPISSVGSPDEANNHQAKYRLELHRILNSVESPQEPPEAMASTKKKRDALDLDKGVFSLKSPRAIARSLKRSAARSRRRKSEPFRSAMSMLNFYLNRAGRKLSKTPGLTRLRMICARYTTEDRPADGLWHLYPTIRFRL